MVVECGLKNFCYQVLTGLGVVAGYGSVMTESLEDYCSVLIVEYKRCAAVCCAVENRAFIFVGELLIPKILVQLAYAKVRPGVCDFL